jgi:RNA polymerase sigma-70 factor (ECF subfamily)
MDETLQQIELYRNQFYRFVHRNVWNPAMAEDVFASAVLAAYENRDQFVPGTNFRAWMFKILVNKCFAANREVKRGFEVLDDDYPAQAPAGTSIPYGEMLRNPDAFLEQCGDEVYQAFRALSTAQRSCILLKDVEQFSYQEIAEILDIPAGTVMTHLSRGRTTLRQRLLDYARRNGIVRTFPRLMARFQTRELRERESGVTT